MFNFGLQASASDDAIVLSLGPHHSFPLQEVPGYLSSDMMPGANGSNEWTIVINFRSADDLTGWQQSKEHGEIIAEGIPLFEGGNFGEVAQGGEADVQSSGDVTEVIFSRIKPGTAARN